MVKWYTSRFIGQLAIWRRKPAEGDKIGKMVKKKVKPVGPVIYIVRQVNAEAVKLVNPVAPSGDGELAI